MALLPPLNPKKLNPRGDFNPEDFRRILFQLGAQITWQQRAQCPCGRPMNDSATDMGYASPLAANFMTGESPAGCAVCKGVGYILHSSQDIPCLVQDMRSYGRRFDNAGEYQQGTARVTFLPEHKLSPGDRLTVKNSVIVVREDRLRSSSAAEALRFPVVSQLLHLSTGDATKRTLFVQKADVNGVTTSGSSLTEGTDFVIDSQGRVDWTLGVANGHAPTLNAHYTVSYYANPRYVITDMGYGVRDTWVGLKHPVGSPQFASMPTMATAKQEWLGTYGGQQ